MYGDRYRRIYMYKPIRTFTAIAIACFVWRSVSPGLCGDRYRQVYTAIVIAMDIRRSTSPRLYGDRYRLAWTAIDIARSTAIVIAAQRLESLGLYGDWYRRDCKAIDIACAALRLISQVELRLQSPALDCDAIFYTFLTAHKSSQR